MYSLRSALLGSALLGSALALSLPVAAMAQNTTPAMNGSAIQISGIVEQASDDLFVLNYGPGKIVVEMDDWDSYPEARALMDGDHVTVFGLIDHDEYEAGSIEAETVFVQELNAYFEASADDEETRDYEVLTIADAPAMLTMTGVVTEVDDEEFTVDTGYDEVAVNVSELAYNPLDDKGYMRIRQGDFVKVSGNLEDGLFEDSTLVAQSISTIVDQTARLPE